MSRIGDKIRHNIRDHLSEREVFKLEKLFNDIKLDLSDDSFPTRTNRLSAVESMKKVLMRKVSINLMKRLDLKSLLILLMVVL